MSTYFDYYIFKIKDGNLLDVTLKNSENNEIVPIGTYSRSFSLDFDREFDSIFNLMYDKKGEQMSNTFYHLIYPDITEEEIKNIMEYESLTYAKYPDFKRLAEDGIREGFFPTEKVNSFKDIKNDYFEISDFKFEEVSPYFYSSLPEEEKRNYVYFTYLDYSSVGYKVETMCTVADALIGYGHDEDYIVIQRVS